MTRLHYIYPTFLFAAFGVTEGADFNWLGAANIVSVCNTC